MASVARQPDDAIFRLDTKAGNAGLLFFAPDAHATFAHSAIWAMRWLGATSAQSGVD